MDQVTPVKATTKKRPLSQFSTIRESFFALALSSLMMNVLALALPLTLLQVYDRVIPNNSYSTLFVLAIGAVIAILLEVLLGALRGYIMGWSGARFEHRVSVAGLKHLMGTRFRDFASDESGVHAERMRSAGHVKRFASGQALVVFMDLPFVVVFLTVIGFIAGWLVLVVLALLVVFVVLTVVSGRDLRTRAESRVVQDDRRYNFLSETFHGIHSVKTMAMEPLMHRRYERLQEANVDKGANVAHGSAVAANMGAMYTQIMIVSVVSVGVYLVVQGAMTPGSMAACIMLSVRSLQPLRSSLSVWMRYQNYKISRRRLRRLFRLPSVEASAFDAPKVIQGSMELRGVGVDFSEDGSSLFKDVNLSVSAGECISIVGDSGSGKTSLLSILNGTLEPNAGEVLIDGIPLNDMEPNAFHASVAFLPQRGVLVAGTILENITMFDASLTDAAVKASEEVGLDRVVAGMRMGYETVVGSGAVDSIPAGIRQRIAIARAIVHGPRIILFDEANLSVDGGGDGFLRQYIESMKGKCTIVLVTMRPSLLRLSDRVFKLEGGRLSETDFDSIELWDEEGKEEREKELIPPHDREWELNDALSHFPETSDLSLCLPTLLTSLEWHGSPRLLAESLPHLAESLDLTGIRSVLANLSFRSNSYNASFKDIDSRLLPCLFVPENSGAKVILKGNRKKGFTYFDSEKNSIQTGKAPSEQGEVIIFSKAGEFNLHTGDDQEAWTPRVFRRFRGFILFVLGLTFLSTILSLTPPLFIMSTFRLVMPTGDLEVLKYLILGVVIALLLDWKMRSLKSRVLSFMAGRSEYIVGNSIFQKVISLQSRSIERVPVSEQVSRIKDLEALRDFFLGPLSLLIYELPATLIYVVVLGIINPWIIVVILIAASSYAILGAVTFRSQARKTSAATRLIARRNEFLTETLEKMLTIRTSGAQDRWIKRYSDLSGEAVFSDLESHRHSEMVSSIARFISFSTGLGAMVFSVTGVLNGELHSSSVIVTMILIWRLTGPLQNSFLASTTLVRVINSLRQINNLMRLKGEQESGKSQPIRPRILGEVAFSRVSFRYSMNADPALLGVTFTAKPGEIVALAGPNGSGKSTLLKLLVNAYQPQAGSIRLDSVDIRQIPTNELRKQVSYMPQHCEVFYGTIAQNLRLAHPTATDEDLHWAARMAGILDDILAMEQDTGKWRRTGFDVRIGDSSSDKLPHGFKQRLAICRTILKQTPILLLDEPGNGLDADGDRAFINALEQLRGKTTIFLASHRPSHLRLADQVIYLEQGAIQAKGSFESIKKTIMAGL